MSHRAVSTTASSGEHGAIGWTADPLIQFNRQLDADVSLLPNEALLSRRLEALSGMAAWHRRVYWLSVARIAELTLKLAGEYADNCEFRSAGDLTVNPRRVDVSCRGWATPVVKDRHRSLSEQFAAAVGDDDPVTWLTRETLTHVGEEALLPHLWRLLASSGAMAAGYLKDLDRRARRIAGTIQFLAAWQVDDSLVLRQRLRDASLADRNMILAKLCRFDLVTFDEMGDDIHRIVAGRDSHSRFLNSPIHRNDAIR